MCEGDPVDEAAPARTRRGFLAALTGVCVGALGTTLERAAPASAANGDAVRAGQTTTATSLTKVQNTADTGAGLWGIAAGSTRHGIYGTNTGGGHGAGGKADSAGVAGVHGESSDPLGFGVWGDATGGAGSIGVIGTASGGGGYGLYGKTEVGTGVAAFASGVDSGSYGVTASGYTGVYASGTDTGIYGEGNTGVHGTGIGATSIGVRADASGGGTALSVAGVAAFDRSGLASIPAGSRSVQVTGVALSASSLVLAVAQAKSPRYVVAAVPDTTNSLLTIYLNNATSITLPVAWFVVN
jgi:hypothetical protein